MNTSYFIVITRTRVDMIEGGSRFVYDSDFVRHPSATAAHRAAERRFGLDDYLVGMVVDGVLLEIDVINFDVAERVRIARSLNLLVPHSDRPVKVTGASLLDDPEKQYITCQGSDLETLSAGVNDAMRKGWVPQGGICATHLADTRAFLYVQALVRVPVKVNMVHITSMDEP